MKGNSKTNSLTDSEFLMWIHRKLSKHYMEDVESDYMCRLENIAYRIRVDEELAYEDID